MLYSGRDISKMLGVAPSTITGAAQKGQLVRDENNFIDIDDPKNKKYLDKLRAKQKNKGTTVFLPTSTGDDDTSPNINDLLDKVDFDIEKLTTPDIIKAFGPALGKTLIDLEKSRADAVLKMQQHRIRKAELVDRDTVGRQLFFYLDSLNKNLLAVGPQIVDRLIALTKTKQGSSRERGIDIINKMIGKRIIDTKKEIARRLKKIAKDAGEEID